MKIAQSIYGETKLARKSIVSMALIVIMVGERAVINHIKLNHDWNHQAIGIHSKCKCVDYCCAFVVWIEGMYAPAIGADIGSTSVKLSLALSSCCCYCCLFVFPYVFIAAHCYRSLPAANTIVRTLKFIIRLPE